LNPAWEEVFGYKTNEMLGKKFSDFQTKEWAERDLKEFNRLLQGNTVKGLETVHLGKDGNEINLIFNAKFIHDHNGNINGTRGTAYDVTKVKKGEDDFQEIESKYSTLFESMSEGVVLHEIVCDSKGNAIDYRILELNPAFEKQTGIQVEKAKNTLASELYGITPAPYLEVYTQVAETGEPANFETYFPPLEKHFSISVFSPKKGMFATIFSDITERIILESKIKMERDQAQSYFDIASVMLLALNTGGEIVKINQKGCDILGYESDDELISKNWFETCLPENIVVEVLSVFNKLINGEIELVEYYENTVLTKYGNEKVIAFRNTFLRDNDSKITGILSSGEDITDRKKTQEALKLSEEKFRLAFKTSPDAISITRLKDGMYIEVNEGFTSMIGYSAEEAVGRTSLEMNIWANQKDREDLVCGLRKDGKVKNLEAIFKKKDGVGVYGLMSAAVIKLNNELHLISVTRDIDKIKKTQQELEQSEIRFRTAFENSAVGICLTSIDGMFLQVNKKLCLLLGYSATELLSLNFKKITHPDDLNKSQANISGAIEKQKDQLHFEKRYLKKNGETIWVEISSSLLRDVDQTPLYFITHIIDITEEKMANQLALESANRYKNLLTNLDAGVVVHAPDTSVILNNERASELLGLSDEQMRGKKAVDSYWRFVHANNLPLKFEEYPVNRIVSTKKPFRNFTLGVIRSIDNHIVWLTVSGLPVLNADGEIMEVLISFIEITEQKLAEEEVKNLNKELELRVAQRTTELEEANKELQSFVYSVSHDLRAPLRSIMGFSQILSKRHISNLNEEGLEYFSYVLEASKNMASLIEDLLRFSRLSKNQVSKEPVALNELIDLVLQSLNKDIEEKNAKIIVSSNIGSVYAERSLLSQILANIIHNAIKYHIKGVLPIVTIDVEEDEKNKTIKITDNGQGIPAEHHEKIFNIFQRLHASDEYPGTGIGLAIVKKAVTTLGGRITVESEVNKGAVFCIILPKG